MDRDVALRIDGYMIALGAVFSSVAEYVQNNVPEEQRQDFIQMIGKGFGEVVGLSNKLYEEYPDIVPKELRPEAANNPAD